MITETITIAELLIRLKDAFNKGVIEGPNLKGSDFTNPIFNGVQNIFLLQSGHYSQSVSKGIQMMSALQAEDPSFYKKLHKGTPYYYIGSAAFLGFDYDTAIYFFNAAAEEDIRDGSIPILNNAGEIEGTSPALKFMLLQGEKDEQWAQKLTEIAQIGVSSCLDFYQNSCKDACVLDIDEIRNNFFLTAIDQASQSNGLSKLRPIICSMIAFVLEWKFRRDYIDIHPSSVSFFPFFSHLFKGCVLFESILKSSPTNYSYKTLGGFVNNLNWLIGTETSANSIQDVVNSLPSSNYLINQALEATCKTRNTIGHKINWSLSISKNHYDLLVQFIMASIFHAIAKEYLNK